MFHTPSSTRNGNAFFRGGDWANLAVGSPYRGCFFIDLETSPSGTDPKCGFRCCSSSSPPPGITYATLNDALVDRNQLFVDTFNEAVNLTAQKRYEDAMKKFHSCLSIAPNNPNALTNLRILQGLVGLPQGFRPAVNESLDPCPAGMARVSAYWGSYCIDRYEAFNDGGKAGSASGKQPLVYTDWNDAKTACTAAGKRLCKDFEWMAACNLDGKKYYLTQEENGEKYSCNTNNKCSGADCAAGNNALCRSDAGVYDMVGNVWEWTDALVPDDSWSGSEATVGSILGEDASKYGDDLVYRNTAKGRAFLRGGVWSSGAGASPLQGCFCVSLDNMPSSGGSERGFRCCSSSSPPPDIAYATLKDALVDKNQIFVDTFNEAVNLTKAKKYSEAIAKFQACLAIDASNANAQANIALLQGLATASTPTPTPVPAPSTDLTTMPTDSDWPMFRHDLARAGGVGKELTPPLAELWRFKTGGVAFSSPVVAGGAAYFGSHDANVYALDAATGKERWRFKTGGEVVSSPAVAGGAVYIGSHDFNVYALDAATGKERWRFKAGNAVESSPAVAGGVAYVGSRDANVYALDAANGKEIWRFKTGAGVFSSPAVAAGAVYVGSEDGNVYALDASTGTEKWRFNASGAVEPSPAVAGGAVYIGSADGNVYALDASTGKERWRFRTGNAVESSPAVAGGAVYVGSYDGNVYAFDASTGKERWRFKTGDRVRPSPAVAGGVVYVGSTDGNLYALDAVTGNEKWKSQTGNWIQSSPAVAGGAVYVGSHNGNVYAFTTKATSPTPTPAPSATTTASPSPTPVSSASPGASPSPTPSASPSATPSPTPAPCPPGTSRCAGSCVDTSSNASHCGGCGRACILSNAEASCASGSCLVSSCAAGFGDCDANATTGCEASLSTAEHCGSCAGECTGGRACLNASCACPAGRSECSGSCVDTASDPANCGSCGRACDAGQVCAASSCTSECPAGTTACSGACVDTASDSHHCGSCGSACTVSRGTPVCSQGRCAVASCAAGYGDCDASYATGCEAELSADRRHCGSCGRACAEAEACVSGKCLKIVQEVERRANGEPCDGPGGCASGNCANGVCCVAGQSCCSSDRDCSVGEACDTERSFCVRLAATAPPEGSAEAKLRTDAEVQLAQARALVDGLKEELAAKNATGTAATATVESLIAEARQRLEGGDYAGAYRSALDAVKAAEEERKKVKKAIGEGCSSDEECQTANCRNVCCQAGERCCTSAAHCARDESCDLERSYCVPRSEVAGGMGLKDRVVERLLDVLTDPGKLVTAVGAVIVGVGVGVHQLRKRLSGEGVEVVKGPAQPQYYQTPGGQWQPPPMYAQQPPGYGQYPPQSPPGWQRPP